MRLLTFTFYLRKNIYQTYHGYANIATVKRKEKKTLRRIIRIIFSILAAEHISYLLIIN